MRQVTFTREWHHRTEPRKVTTYKAHETYNVSEAVAKKAEADGAIPKLPLADAAPKGD